jgi:glucokinase
VRRGDTELGLVGDIGGTNCRFALAAGGSAAISLPVSYPCADFENAADAIGAYLRREGVAGKIAWAVIAVAGPVDRNAVMLTNRDWRMSGAELARTLGIGEVRLVNDFAALAASTPHIDEQHLIALGGGAPNAVDGVTTSAVVGPGTGLGAGGLIRGPGGTVTLTSEGGHTTFAPCDDLEREIVRLLLQRFDRISNERLLSGDGLRNIYWALCAMDGAPHETLQAQEVTRRAAEGSDPRSALAMQVFSRVLGAFGGDVVLTFGARGGLYLAGGMMRVILPMLDRAAFRERFEAKGRLRPFMAEIPAWVVVHPYPALIGAAALAADRAPAELRTRDRAAG